MVEALPLLYSSQKEMELIYSELGVTLRLDDVDDDVAPQTTIAERLEAVIQDATDECNEYLLHIYDAVDLNESRVVRRWCSLIACHILSRRRGNPGQFNDEYDRIILKMIAVREQRD